MISHPESASFEAVANFACTPHIHLLVSSYPFGLFYQLINRLDQVVLIFTISYTGKSAPLESTPPHANFHVPTNSRFNAIKERFGQ